MQYSLSFEDGRMVRFRSGDGAKGSEKARRRFVHAKDRKLKLARKAKQRGRVITRHLVTSLKRVLFLP